MTPFAPPSALVRSATIPGGYYEQSGDKLVCQNCGNQFSMDRVEVEAGGCNFWPIMDENKTVTEDSITISYDFLNKSAQIFKNWKVEY